MLVLVSLASIGPRELHAQALTLAAGRVLVPHATDTVPLPGARVLLHRVGRDAQGPIDSVVADRSGRFHFRFHADTSALYLLSARYGGIEYFSPPVHTSPALPDTALEVLAYDTSSTVPVQVEARHIVVPRAGPDGARDVLDLVVLRNDGLQARVAPDSTHPTWFMRLPAGSGEMQVGESELSPDAVVRAGDTVKVFAPIAPGQKQLSVEYATQPVGGRLVFPVGAASESLNVLVEERDARVTGGSLAVADTQTIEGRTFRRFTGTVPAGGAITLAVGAGPMARARPALAVLVGAVALALLVAGARALRAPDPGRPAATEPLRADADRLLDGIAALDARYAGREPEMAPEEWQRYTAERAALKAELERALAGRPTGPYV
ncbi:MAG: hypothetical protein ACTHM9_01795 [Gemmatimonadales bacterium]